VTLNWGDVDLKRGVLRALATKNDMPHVFALELPGLLPMLRAWHVFSGEPDASTPILRDIGVDPPEFAKTLRADLFAAGVKRPELHDEENPKSEALRFHDCRATFCTWAHRQGRSLGWITDRTGHLDQKMVQRYTRVADTFASLEIVPFPHLTHAIPELAPRGTGPGTSQGPDGLSQQPENADLDSTASSSSESLQHESKASACDSHIVVPGVAGSIPVTHPRFREPVSKLVPRLVPTHWMPRTSTSHPSQRS